MSYRVVVWGPGNVGLPALRTVIANPALELCGVLVHSAEKEGIDAGILAGGEPVGVVALRDTDAVLASAPDAIFYGASQDFRANDAHDDMLGALESGIDVVTAGLYGLLHPDTADAALRERFARACEKGQSTFLCSGIDPGFAMDKIPLLLSGLCEEIREIRMIENFNYATYEVPPAVKDIIGFGFPMERTPLMLLPGVPQSVWGGAIRGLAAALDLELSEIREVIERHPLERDIALQDGSTLAEGTQGAFRFEVQGIADGRPILVVEHVTRIVDDTAPQWPAAQGMGFHRVRVTGRPSIELTLECDVDGDHVAGGNAAAAGRLVNAIPWVCEAPPGLLSGADVPVVSGRGLVRI